MNIDQSLAISSITTKSYIIRLDIETNQAASLTQLAVID